jgi:hypothetical protein
MSSSLVVYLVVTVLWVALLLPAERALLNLTRRHLDLRWSRRVIRSVAFFAGVAAFIYVFYEPLYRCGKQWWFISFFVVASLWKLLLDVLIVGVPDRSDSSKPSQTERSG